jgi:hypothetical protein
MPFAIIAEHGRTIDVEPMLLFGANWVIVSDGDGGWQKRVEGDESLAISLI